MDASLDMRQARIAHSMNSMGEFRSEEVEQGYSGEVAGIVDLGEERKKQLLERNQGIEVLLEIEEIDRLVSSYKSRLLSWYNKGFAIESRCPSVLISGPSNFPIKKKEKQNSMRDKHMEDYADIKHIADRIRAVGSSIKGTDANAAGKLRQKIAKLKGEQAYMKAANAFYRKNGTMAGFRDITADEAQRLDAEIIGACSWERVPYPSWKLSGVNNGIKQAEIRLQDIEPVTDLEISFDLEVAFRGCPGAVPKKPEKLTLENIAEMQGKLDSLACSALIAGRVSAGDKSTKIAEWAYSKNSVEYRDWYKDTIVKAISCGVSGGTFNKMVISACWDKYINGSTRKGRQAEKLDGAETIGGGQLRLEEGRLNVYFGGKPGEDIRAKLKKAGLKWSPGRMAWTRQDTTNARYSIKDVLSDLG